MKKQSIAAAAILVSSAFVSSVAGADKPAQSDGDLQCDSLESFAKLDPSVALEGAMAEQAEQLSAELIGQAEVTAIAEENALPPDEAQAAGVEPTMVSPEYSGVEGVRAVVFDADANPTVIAVPDAPRPETGYPTLTSCVRDQDIDTVDDAITGLDVEGEEFVAAGYSPYADRIDIRTSLDPRVVADALPASLTDRHIRIRQANASRADRRWDYAAHYAGARINDGSGGYECSSGFHVWSSAYGPFMLSAGHCSSGVSQVFNNGDNSQYFGTVSAYSFPNPDLLMMNGSTYVGRTYSEPNQTGWARVEGASNPGYNVSYCNNGANSRETCSNLTDASDTFCDAGGCTTNLAYHERACAWGPIVAPRVS